MSSRPDTPSTTATSTVLPGAELRGDERVLVYERKSRFERVDALGEGATGLVELARDNDIGRLVAVKRLKNSEDPEHVLRFTREVRSLGQLEHPGIVPVHDVGRGEDGRYFLVMKHLVGDTLERVIARLRAGDPDYHEKYPLNERLRICEAVLRIMEYAHDEGVIHRDIKPGNIMIGPHGEVTIVDWGLSKQLASDVAGAISESEDPTPDEDDGLRTRVGVRMGTPIYMSPEQAGGPAAEVGPASDLYSMAVVFYEFLALEHYLGVVGDIPEILSAVALRPAKLAYWLKRDDQPRVPIEIAQWLDRAMQKDIEDRFSSATEMRITLQNVMDGKFAVVCPTTFTRRLLRIGMDGANRRPILTVSVVLAIGALVVLGLWTLIGGLL